MEKIITQTYRNQPFLFKFAFSFLLLFPLLINLGISTSDLAMTLTGILFIIHSIFEKDFSFLKEKWFQLILLLWGYLIVRNIFTETPSKSLPDALLFIRFPLCAIAIQYWLLKNKASHQLLAFSLTATLLFVALNGYLEIMSGKDLFGHTYIGATSILHGFGRARALNNKLNLGAITEMIAFPSIAYLLTKPSKNKFTAGVWLCMVIIISLLVPLTGERGATLKLLLGFILLSCFLPVIRKKIIVLLLIIIFGLTAAFFFNASIKERLIHSTTDVAYSILKPNQKISPYSQLMKMDWNFIKESPFFGTGLSLFDQHCKESAPEIAVYKSIDVHCITHPHNLYLEWLCTSGIAGFILFLAFLSSWLCNFWKNRRLLLSNPIVTGALVAILIRLWPFTSDSSFFFAWNALPFWWMGGWVLAYIKYEAKHKQ